MTIPFEENPNNSHFSFHFFQFFGDHYHFQHHELRKRSVEPSHHHQTRLISDERVRWSQQQRIKSRKKRDYQPYPMTMGKNRVFTTDPKWPQMWYLVSSSVNMRTACTLLNANKSLKNTLQWKWKINKHGATREWVVSYRAINVIENYSKTVMNFSSWFAHVWTCAYDVAGWFCGVCKTYVFTTCNHTC